MSAGRLRRLWAPRGYGILGAGLNLAALLFYLGGTTIYAMETPQNCRWLLVLEALLGSCWMCSVFFAFSMGCIGIGKDDRKAVAVLGIAASVVQFVVVF